MAGRMTMMAGALALAVIAGATHATEPSQGVVRVQSPHSVAETLDRVEAALKGKGLKVFGRLDHAAAAEEYDLEMPPTVVFVFGNPKMGTPAMIKNPVSAIDFPLKGVVYEDADGQTWIAYNTADYVFREIFPRHGLNAPEANIAGYAKLLDGVTAEATAK